MANERKKTVNVTIIRAEVTEFYHLLTERIDKTKIIKNISHYKCFSPGRLLFVV